MAEPRIEELETDNEAMRELLREHGLLLRLPQATLERILEGEDQVQVCKQQLELQARAIESRARDCCQYEALDDGVRDASVVADLEDGKDAAADGMMALLLAHWDIFSTYANYGTEPWSADEVDHENNLLSQMAEVLHDCVICANGKGQVWDATALVAKMRENPLYHSGERELFDADEGRYGYCGWYARWCLSRSSAHSIAQSVVQDRLPPELMLMVGECMYTGPDLSIDPHRLYCMVYWPDTVKSTEEGETEE